MTLGDDLMLLAIRPRTGRVHRYERMDFALRAAELFELALAGRIGVATAHGRIVVGNAAPTGERRLDNVLRLLDAATPEPTIRDWLKRTWRGTTTAYLSRLEDQGAIRVDRRARRYAGSPPPIAVLDRPRHAATKQRVTEAARHPDCAALDRALAALVHAAGLAGPLYRGPHRRATRHRLARLSEVAPFALDGVAGTAVPGDPALAALISETIGTGISEMARQLGQELRSEERMDYVANHHHHHGEP